MIEVGRLGSGVVQFPKFWLKQRGNVLVVDGEGNGQRGKTSAGIYVQGKCPGGNVPGEIPYTGGVAVNAFLHAS